MAAATVAAAAATAVAAAAVQAYRHRDWMALIVPRVMAGEDVVSFSHFRFGLYVWILRIKDIRAVTVFFFVTVCDGGSTFGDGR